jgi:hypothetical protein
MPDPRPLPAALVRRGEREWCASGQGCPKNTIPALIDPDWEPRSTSGCGVKRHGALSDCSQSPMNAENGALLCAGNGAFPTELEDDHVSTFQTCGSTCRCPHVYWPSRSGHHPFDPTKRDYVRTDFLYAPGHAYLRLNSANHTAAAF